MLRALVIGAGAVGRVFGHHLARGGAEVTFLVREQYRAQTQRGQPLIRLDTRRRREVLPPQPFHVATRVAEIAARRFDQVYLAISSTGLTRPWLDALITTIRDSAVINLTPSPGDRELLLEAGLAPERLVSGFLSLVAYQSPLAGEPADVPAGTTVWFPPGAPCLFSGPLAPRDSVVAALRAGGLAARAHLDVPARGAFASSSFMAVLLALEAAGWSLRELAAGPRLAEACAGARQAIDITAVSFGRPPRALAIATHPRLLAATLRLAERAAPFPLEPYLREHFTKVGAQTRLIVRQTIDRGRAAGQPVDALERLLAAALRR